MGHVAPVRLEVWKHLNEDDLLWSSGQRTGQQSLQPELGG